VGRLFDAASALVGVCEVASYEAEAAMRFEALCTTAAAPVDLPLRREAGGLWRTDWAPLVTMLLNAAEPIGVRAARFHASLAQALVDQAVAVRAECGVGRIGLCGGVFQNRQLTERVAGLLAGSGFEMLLPRRLPLNDAAISYGQLIEVGAMRTYGH
jgi:hydrogenase maturation protein HypF